MIGRTTGASLVGVDACLVEVEAYLGGGLPAVSAVGLPDTSVREGLDRVRAAIRNAGFEVPAGRTIVNLAPAELRKQGAGLDLPIAVAMLIADGQIRPPGPSGTVSIGELALDATVRPVRGALSIAMAARDAGRPRLLVPRADAREAALVEGIEVVGVSTLADVVALGAGAEGHARTVVDRELVLAALEATRPDADLREVRGQALARRALEISAAGGHNLLLTGPPGAGKTMLARRMPGILPPLGLEEALEVTRIWSAAGLRSGLATRRPFRAPHHGISAAGLVGGGARPRPGEVTLANGGVLFLDELPEFRRDALEALRQPMEDGSVTIVRTHARATFPASFALVAAMNPCPCGHHGSPGARCRCTPNEVRRYRGKLSGPLLDRFDLLVEVPPVDPAELGRRGAGECSGDVRRRVVRARARQQGRFGPVGVASNSRIPARFLDAHARLEKDAREALVEACRRLGLSARGVGRVRRVARTLADLEGSDEIGPAHVAEAVLLRRTLDTFLK
jgi:magnesium chelatase family protein